jgi:hypothetical protein
VQIKTDKIEGFINEYNRLIFLCALSDMESIRLIDLKNDAIAQLESIKHPIKVEVTAVNNFSDRIFGNPAEKPPLGIMPRKIHQEIRRNDLIAAIERYRQVGKNIPPEWYDELSDILIKLKTTHEQERR